MRSQYQLWPLERCVLATTADGSEIKVCYDLAGDVIENADGSRTPADFTYVETPADPTLPFYVVEFEHAADDETPRIRGIQVMAQRGGREVLSSDVRKMRPLEDVLEEAWSLVSRPATSGATVDPSEVASRMKANLKGVRRRARRKINGSVHAEVARIYREARRTTGAPTKAVGEHFGIQPSTASLYVKRARKAGENMGDDDRG